LIHILIDVVLVIVVDEFILFEQVNVGHC